MALEKIQPMRKWFLKLTLRTKWITPSERALKTVPDNGVGSCVHFCLRSLVALERCGKTYPRKDLAWLFIVISGKSLFYLAGKVQKPEKRTKLS